MKGSPSYESAGAAELVYIDRSANTSEMGSSASWLGDRGLCGDHARLCG